MRAGPLHCRRALEGCYQDKLFRSDFSLLAVTNCESWFGNSDAEGCVFNPSDLKGMDEYVFIPHMPFFIDL